MVNTKVKQIFKKDKAIILESKEWKKECVKLLKLFGIEKNLKSTDMYDLFTDNYACKMIFKKTFVSELDCCSMITFLFDKETFEPKEIMLSWNGDSSLKMKTFHIKHLDFMEEVINKEIEIIKEKIRNKEVGKDILGYEYTYDQFVPFYEKAKIALATFRK